jgi:hypothetical protein
MFAGIFSSHATERDFRLEHRVSKTNSARFWTRVKINEEKTINDVKARVASITGIPLTDLVVQSQGDYLDNETILKSIPKNKDCLRFFLRKGADVSSSDESDFRIPLQYPTSKEKPGHFLGIKAIDGNKNIADLKAVIASDTDIPATDLVAIYREEIVENQEFSHKKKIFENETILKNLPTDISLLCFEFRRLDLDLIAGDIKTAILKQDYASALTCCNSVLNSYLAREDDKKRVETWLQIIPKQNHQ